MRYLSALLLTMAFSTSALAATGECGRDGSVAERIASCATSKKTTLGSWSLVTRVQAEKDLYKEVWRDDAADTLWSDQVGPEGKLYPRFTHAEAEKLCGGGVSRDARGGEIDGVRWKLASAGKWQSAFRRGAREVLPNLDGRLYWTSTYADIAHRWAHVVHGDDGHVGRDALDVVYYARCVSYNPED